MPSSGGGQVIQSGRDLDRPPGSATPAVMGAVLVGGGSRRMGRDKATLVVDGSDLRTRAVAALDRALPPGAAVVVVGPHPDASDRMAGEVAPEGTGSAAPTRPVRTTADLRVDAGPLAGLEAALAAAGDAEVVLLIGVDHPWLVPGVLALLVEELAAAAAGTDAVVLGTERGAQLLLGAYRRSALPVVRGLLDGGERRLLALTDHLDVEVVPPARWWRRDPLGATAVDVDTPAALTAALSWHQRATATAAALTPPTAPASPRGADLVPEAPLELRVAGPGQTPRTITTLLRTPGQDRDLAVGWLLAAGGIDPAEVAAATTTTTSDATSDATTTGAAAWAAAGVGLATPDVVTVRLRREWPAATDTAVATSWSTARDREPGVGMRVDRVATLPPVTGDPFGATPVSWSILTALPERLRVAQLARGTTGGRHAAGLFTATGQLVTLREDIGRHNALDAVIGAHALAGVWPPTGLDDLVLVLTSRVGAALVVAAAAARLPVVAAVGTPSTLAVAAADHLGVTLVSPLRDGTGTVHTHPHRLVLPTPASATPGG